MDKKLLRSLGIEAVPVSQTKRRGRVSDFRLSDAVATDAYVAEGAPTLGSGRSCFVGNYQVKGVGRTVLAPAPSLSVDEKALGFSVSDGRFVAYSIFSDVVVSHWLKKILATPTFALLGVLEDSRGNLLLVRDGTPIRLAHILLMQANSNKFGTGRKSQILWRHFFNVQLGRDKVDVPQSLFGKFVGQQIAIATNLTAACRIYGVSLPNYSDNFDINNRLFDLEDARLCFRSLNNRGLKYRVKETDLIDLLDQFQGSEQSDRRMMSLQTLSSTVKTLKVLSTAMYGINWRLRQSEIKKQYEIAVLHHLGRLLGIDSNHFLKRLRRRIGRSLDLVPADGTTEFRFDILLRSLIDIQNGGRVSVTGTYAQERQLARWIDQELDAKRGRQQLTSVWSQNWFLISEDGLYAEYSAMKARLYKLSGPPATALLKKELGKYYDRLERLKFGWAAE